MPAKNLTTFLRRKVPVSEAAQWRAGKIADGTLLEVKVEGWRAAQLALGADRSDLETLMAGQVPPSWRPIDTTTDEEATFLSPLDPVSARGRAKPLFDFDYIWEVYKPAAQRRWGYYTLPILWGDRLVARFDSKLDRPSNTLVILGLWLEDGTPAGDAAFHAALASAMHRFRQFLDAKRLDASALAQARIRRAIESASAGRKARSARVATRA